MCWICGQRDSGGFVSDVPVTESGSATYTANSSLPVFSIAQISNQLLNGYWENQGGSAFQWGPGNTTITYNVAGLSAGRATLARLAFATWQEVSGLTFQETGGSAEITVDDNASGAYAYSSTWNNNITTSTINVASNWESGDSSVDSYTFGTFIHEIGHTLGLGHGGNYNGNATYGVDNHYRNDTTQYSIMSYFGQDEYGGASYRYNFTPMMADIYAVQSVYGAGTARTGNTTYGFNVTGLDAATAQLYTFSNWSSAPALTIYDSGGTDTLDVSGYSQSQVINLAGGSFSNIGGLTGNIGIYTTSVIENAIGGSGNDTIYGNSSNNVLNGGGGSDTYVVANSKASYLAIAYKAQAIIKGSAAEGTDRLENIETVKFSDENSSLQGLPQFKPYDYLATSMDVLRALGSDPGLSWGHYYKYGYAEGRNPDSFENYRYIASFSDLISAFGLNADAGAEHFVKWGLNEGRDKKILNFLEYAASYSDVLLAFGSNQDALARHYIEYGRHEGRNRDVFDNLRYVASNTDLIAPIGLNLDKAAEHYVLTGFSQNRNKLSFDPYQYLASYGDLISAFGLNGDAASAHFIEYGFTEDRPQDRFNAQQYLLNYSDLRAAFGMNEDLATKHFILYGYSEHRTDAII